MINELNGSIT